MCRTKKGLHRGVYGRVIVAVSVDVAENCLLGLARAVTGLAGEVRESHSGVFVNG